MSPAPVARARPGAAAGGDDGGDAIVITGIGAASSVGFQAPQTMTSILAGVCRFEELPAYQPVVRAPGMRFPEPATAAEARGLTAGLAGIERLLALGRPALREALADAELDEADVAGLELIVGGGDRPDAAAGSRQTTVLGPRLVAAVAPRAKAVRTTYLPGGSAAALLALDGAVRRLRRGECRRAVVGGVDSWLDRGTLAWLDGARRLKTAEVQDGFIPGEAAAFVVVERAADAARRGRAPYARCSDVFTAREANTIEVDTVCTAQALTDCLRPAVADLRGQGDRANTARTARAVLCDLNGESYRSTEWAYALTRVFGAESPPPPVLLHPADCVGDVGAASGALLLAAAAWAIRRQPARWDASLLWCSSDKGERAACWLGSA